MFGRQAACTRRRAGAKSKSLQSKLFLPKNVSISCHCEDRAKTGRRFCSKTPASSQNRSFSNKTAAISCHCEERSDAAILKFEAWHPVAKHGSTKQKEIPIIKNMDSLLHSASSLFIYGSVSFRATIVRYGMANRSVKDCRVGRTRPPRNDKTDRFCGKTEQFPERNDCKTVQSDTAQKITAKMKTVRFPNKNVPILCHCEERSDAAILKFEAWHPVAKHGSTKQEGSPITKTWIHCFILLPLSSFQGSVSFRATIVRFGMTNRFVKDCRVGRKSCALLAMTNLVGFAGKRSNFRNETFEKRCGATPRKKCALLAMTQNW